MSSLHKPSASTSSNASQYPLPSLCSSVSSTTSSLKSFPLTRTSLQPVAPLLHHDLPQPALPLARRQKQQQQQQQQQQHQQRRSSSFQSSPWPMHADRYGHGRRADDVDDDSSLRHVSFDEAIVVIPASTGALADTITTTAALRPAPSIGADNPSRQVMDASRRTSHDSAETLSSQWWDDSLALELAEDDFLKTKTRRFRPKWLTVLARPASFLAFPRTAATTADTSGSTSSASTTSDTDDTHTPSRRRYPSLRSPHLMSQSLQKLKSLLAK